MAEEIQGFGGFDSMKDSVGEVLGSTDDVAAAVDFVGDHGDDIADLVRKLPALPASTAEALTEAADDVANAVPDGGIGRRIGDAAARFDRVGDRLADAAGQLRELGDAVDSAGKGLARTVGKLEAGGRSLARFSD